EKAMVEKLRAKHRVKGGEADDGDASGAQPKMRGHISKEKLEKYKKYSHKVDSGGATAADGDDASPKARAKARLDAMKARRDAMSKAARSKAKKPAPPADEALPTEE